MEGSVNKKELLEVLEWAEEHLRDYGADSELHNQLCDKLKAAIAIPARICDKMDRHKAIYDCRTYLKRHGYRLSDKQDEVMMQTIYWLYDQTKEAEVSYGIK